MQKQNSAACRRLASEISPNDKAAGKPNFHDEWMIWINKAITLSQKLHFVEDTLRDFNPRYHRDDLPQKITALTAWCSLIIEETAKAISDLAQFMDDAEFMMAAESSSINAISPELTNLIEGHKAAHKYFDSVCDFNEEGNPRYDEHRGHDIWKGANAAEEKVLMELCSYVPQNGNEVSAQATYLLAHDQRNEIEFEFLTAYLAAVARMK